jgi:hypothetical protein
MIVRRAFDFIELGQPSPGHHPSGGSVGSRADRDRQRLDFLLFFFLEAFFADDDFFGALFLVAFFFFGADFLPVLFVDFLADFFGAFLAVFLAVAALATFLAAFFTDFGTRLATALEAFLATVFTVVSAKVPAAPATTSVIWSIMDLSDWAVPLVVCSVFSVSMVSSRMLP